MDAVEFALQARIARSKPLNNPLYPSARNLASNGPTSVEVVLSDGAVVKRGIVEREDGWHVTNGLAHPSFSIAPFVLRRSDLLRFLDTPESRRQLIFSDYRLLDRNAQSSEVADEFDDNLEARLTVVKEGRARAKSQRRHIAGILAPLLSVHPDEIPIERNAFDKFVVEKLYGGLSSSEAKKQRMRRGPLDPRVAELLNRMREEIDKVKALNNELSQLKKLGTSKGSDNSVFSQRARGLAEVLQKASDFLTQAFKEISTADFVDQITLVPGELNIVSLRIDVQLSDSQLCGPHQVFSEANLDLLAFLVFVAVAKAASQHGQARVLALDDVLQSVDATIRVSAIDFLLREFSDWQLIVTCHDRLWQEQLRQMFRRNGHQFVERDIVRWSFDYGPVIRDALHQPESALLEAISNGDAIAICSLAGLLLEEICDRLSWTLPISVTRRYEDRYTLGDLWPGVLKGMRKTTIREPGDRLDRFLHLRNLVGAHYNEWAHGISTNEAVSFGEAVVELLWQVRCGQCGRWIEQDGLVAWSCRCRATRLTLVKD